MGNMLLTTSLNFFRNACCPTLSGLRALWQCPPCRRDVPCVPWCAPWFPPQFLLKETWAKDVDRELSNRSLTMGAKWTRPKSVPTPCKSPECKVPLSACGYRNWHALILSVYWFSRLCLWKQRDEWQALCLDRRAQLPMLWSCCDCPCPKLMSSEIFVGLIQGLAQARDLNQQAAWVWKEVSNVYVIKWCQLSSMLESRPAHFHCMQVPLDSGNHCPCNYIQYW